MSQPTPVTDLGELSGRATISSTVFINPREVIWYRLSVPAIAPPERWLDIWTAAGADPALSNGDTIIALYNSSGTRVGLDDDDGHLDYSALSFGAVTPARPAVGGSLSFNGRDGSLPGGVYYLAVAAYRTDFALAAWGTLAITPAMGNVALTIDAGCSSCPTPPTCAAACSPNLAAIGQSVLLTAAVAPGLHPLSTGLTVRADLSALGGPAQVALRDDGQQGDVFALDGIYSIAFETPAIGAGTFAIPVHVTDAQLRSTDEAPSLAVLSSDAWVEAYHGHGDASESPNAAQAITGMGPLATILGSTTEFDADLFLIRIDDPASFSATAEARTQGADPVLFLFEACRGTGIAANDNAVALLDATAQLGPTLVPHPGLYLLGISGSGYEPFDSFGFPLWATRSPRSEAPPDNHTPLGAWFGQAASMEYVVSLTGCQRVDPGVNPCACPADFDGNGVIDPDDLGDFINCYFAAPPCAASDFNTSGATDPDDLGDYINSYFGHFGSGDGCP